MNATYLRMLISCVPDGTRISFGFHSTEAMSLTGQTAVRGGSECCCDVNVFAGCVPDGTLNMVGFHPTTEAVSLTGQMAVCDGSRPRRGQGSVTKKCNKCVGAYFCHAVSKNCDNA